jgi:hypothetical protein
MDFFILIHLLRHEEAVLIGSGKPGTWRGLADKKNLLLLKGVKQH